MLCWFGVNREGTQPYTHMYNMDESREDHAKWKKSVTKDHIYDSTHVKYLEETNPQRQRVAGGWGVSWRKWGVTTNGDRVSSEGDEMFSTWLVMAAKSSKHTKNQ